MKQFRDRLFTGRSLFLWVVLLFLALAAYRLLHVSPFAASYDIANFALAVGQYDLADLRPHFPGYPFFILVATVLPLDPVLSLGTVSTIGFASSIIPAYLLLKRSAYDPLALLQAVAFNLIASIVVISATGMSDGLALGLLVWFAWSVEQARLGKRRFLPYILFGLLMATRLSYAPVGIILLFLLFQKRKDGWQLVSELSVLVLAQLAWLLPVAFSTGGPLTFARLALSFVDGHFSDWGGSAATDAEPLVGRLSLVLKQIFWHGFAFGSMIGLLGLAFLAQRPGRIERWWGVTAATYFAWALLAQNIDKPRHLLPLVLILAFYLLRRPALPVALFALTQFYLGLALVEQAKQPPATIQLADWISEELPRGATVFTDEEARQFSFSRPEARIVPVASLSKWKAEPKGRDSYVTGRLLERLREQGAKIDVERVASFRSDPRFEPEDASAVLYRLK